MSTLKGILTAAGNTVEADEAITVGNLSNDQLFVIGEPTSTPTAGELTTLASWVNGGGILLLLGDSGNSGLPGLNNISAGIGGSLTWSGSSSGAALAGGVFASTGPPFNIVGQSLAETPGTAVGGGTALAGSLVQYQHLGSGWIFGFADRSDHNVNVSSGNVNAQLYLNLAGGTPSSSVPEPSTGLLLLGGLAGVLGAQRRKRD
ncbi:MAG TPA: PEP-CTERM sorting domain-containing protein [Bryobacteraceae bacterium]|nr:PEP-CTERM sorting domain-containing protein [Bryobacteraceae bacterium]